MAQKHCFMIEGERYSDNSVNWAESWQIKRSVFSGNA